MELIIKEKPLPSSLQIRSPVPAKYYTISGSVKTEVFNIDLNQYRLIGENINNEYWQKIKDVLCD